MRIVGFIILLFVSLTMSFPVFLFFSFLYVFFYPGYELLIIAILIDIVFGPTTTSVLYTLSVSTLIIGAELVRPYLSWYMTRV